MKSRLNIRSILIIAIIGIVSLVYFNPSFAANTVKVAVGTANIRQTPDQNAKLVEQATKGQTVEILEKNGEWYKVKYNGVQGYVKKDLLELQEENTQVQNNTSTQVQTTSQTQENSVQEQASSQTQENSVQEQASSQAQENSTQEQANTQNQESTNAQTVTTATETKNVGTETTGIYTCKENVKLKILPLIMGLDIKEINKDAEVNVLEVNNKWALVESGTQRGWVLVSKIEKATNNEQNSTGVVEANSSNQENEEQKEEAKTEETKQEETKQEETKQEEKTPEQTPVEEHTMYVNSDVINLRKEATTSSESLAKLTKATQVTVTAEGNGWSKVKVNGKEGYISTPLLSKTKPQVVTSRAAEEPRQDTTAKETTETKTEAASETTTSSGKGQEVVNYAKQFLGCKYVYGGTSPNGFDCSGFTQYVYKHFGVSLNRTAEAQTGNGTAVSKSNLKAGDLVIFKSHVGIALGNGQFIHAANSKSGVIISSLSESYYVKNYITARRIFN